MTYNTTASLDKLTCTDYVEFGKFQDRFGWFFWSKNDSSYLDVNLKVFKKDDNRDFRLVEDLTTRGADLNQFLLLRNQLGIAAENFGRKENMSPFLIPTMSKDMDEQLELPYKVVEVVDRPYGKKWVTLLRYILDKPETSYAQVEVIAWKKD